MKVIGAGLPRTGTLSQKVALEMLGFKPCYHMVNLLVNLDEVPMWRRALDRDCSWDEVFGDAQATVDWPGAFFYRELSDAYPEAKVLLSVRDAAGWERSMRGTIWGVMYGDNMMRDLSSARARIDPGWQSYNELMRELWHRSEMLDAPEGDSPEGGMGAAMERYNSRVRETVPADRLLVWSVGDGWEPLCRFLGVDVPSAPFPHLNDKQMFGDRVIDGSLQALTQWRAQDAQAAHAAQDAHAAQAAPVARAT